MKQQKGRRIPIQLQKAVDVEIRRVLKEDPFEKIKIIKEHVFIQPTVITVKKYRLLKLAFDAIALRQAIDEDAYHMASSENLPDMQTDKNRWRRRGSMVLIRRHDICLYSKGKMQDGNQFRTHQNF